MPSRKKKFFSKFLWHDFFDIRECQHYNSYLGACGKKFAKCCLVRPQSLGAHYDLIGFSRIHALSKKKIFSKSHCYEVFDIRVCHHYISYLGTGAKTFSKLSQVRPQYRGAHYYLSGTSLIYAPSKFFFFLSSYGASHMKSENVNTTRVTYGLV